MKTLINLFVLVICLYNISVESNNKNLIWGRQFGTPGNDRGQGIAVDDSSNVYVSGFTTDSLVQNNAGGQDGFLVKYSSAGQMKWSSQIGTNKDDRISCVAVDKDYNCYIVGTTGGSFKGYSNIGGLDCFMVKLNPAGEMMWLYQFGSSRDDNIRKIVIDNMNSIYACGYTYGQLGSEQFGNGDAFVIKMNDQGVQQWLKQYGTAQDEYCTTIIADNDDNLLVAGSTKGDWGATNAGDYDNYIFRLNNEGEMLQIFQYGTGSEDEILGMAVDEEGIMYPGGFAGNYATVTAMDNAGAILWNRQFGEGISWSGTWEVKLFPDSSGDILAGGCLNWDNSKAFMRRYSRKGDLVWENLLFNNESKMTNGKVVAIDKDGNCYQTGYTNDDLFSKLLGDKDAFLIKINGAKTSTHINGLNLKQPDDFHLYQNYPNPFNPTTHISFGLPKTEKVKIELYNITGEKVKTLIYARMTAGYHILNFNGSALASGIYIYRIQAGEFVKNMKMILLK